MTGIRTTGLACDWNRMAGVPVAAYQKGVLTDRATLVVGDAGAVIHVSSRSPWTFVERTSTPLGLSQRSAGRLELAFEDGSKLLWEAPNHLVRITAAGQRLTEKVDHPVLLFQPEFLVPNQILLKQHLTTKASLPFSVYSLEQNELVKIDFVRAELCSAAEDASLGAVWRWSGERPLPDPSCPQAKLTMTAPFDLLISEDGDLVGWSNPVQDSVTVAQGYECCSPLQLWRSDEISQAERTTVTLAEARMARMSDNICLAATVMLPGDSAGKALPGPFPTILIRTPYGRDLALQDAFKFVSRGYAVVSQDVRGRGDSEGTFEPLRDDIRDGDDTLNWLAAQPWCDGHIGMIGASYLGWAQWQAAASGNTHLKAMISIVPAFRGVGDLPYVNGMFCAGMLTWSIVMGADPERLSDALAWDLNAAASELPLIDADIRAVGQEIPFWRAWVNHPSLDAYWRAGDVLAHQDAIDLPVLHIVGWYDDVLRGTMAAYQMMTANDRANQHLLVGPWPHGVNGVRSLGELSFGANACRADMHHTFVRWFDRWLKGRSNGTDREPPVRYFTMGQNEWHEAHNWPPSDTLTQRWYLHSDDGDLGRQLVLVTLPPEGPQPPDHYAHDPANPVPYLVDIRANQLSVPEDYQEVERRDDVLVYTSEAFTEALDISGTAEVVLYASTDQVDTDWVVRLCDVVPDGRSINIIDGYLRARFRNGMEREEPVIPGEITRYRIPMTWTSYRFAPGHRMRLSVASAAAGAFVVNTNTGNPTATDREMRVARQSVHHSAQHPSHIELSIRPENGKKN